MKSYLRIFAPWIACAVAWSVDGWQAAMLAGAIVAVLMTAGSIRRSSADLLTIGTIGYFVVMTGVSVVAPHSALQHYTPALSLATMGVLGAGSLAVRRPFTMTIARQMTSPDEWHHPVFYRTNVVITGVWTSSFLATAATCALVLAARPPATSAWIGLLEATGFLVPTLFTRRYPARVRARARRSMHMLGQPMAIAVATVAAGMLLCTALRPGGAMAAAPTETHPAQVAPFTWALTLSADPQVLEVFEDSTTLTATTNADVGPTPYYIGIHDRATGTWLAECPSGTTCSVSAVPHKGNNNFYDAVVGPFHTLPFSAGTLASASTQVFAKTFFPCRICS